MRLADLDRWARAHHGIITLEASGLSRAAWYRAIRNGQLEQVHPGVARLIGTAATPEQRIVAGVLAVGVPAVASHRSAARLWGVPRPHSDPVDVIVTGRRRDLRLDGVVVHRPTDRARLTPQRRHGIACTNILRTLVDLGAVDPHGVHTAVGHALATRIADLPAIETAVSEHATQGRHGVVALRRALQAWRIDDRPADSVLESAMRVLTKRHRLPPIEFHPTIEGYEVDFRVADTRILLECDGWMYHGVDRAGFERDRVRDAVLIGAGWIVLRFTYRSITTRPAEVAGRIRRAVDRWSAT